VIEVPLDFTGWVEPAHVAARPDTGRGKLKPTDVDAKLAGWDCEEQLSLDNDR